MAVKMSVAKWFFKFHMILLKYYELLQSINNQPIVGNVHTYRQRENYRPSM